MKRWRQYWFFGIIILILISWAANIAFYESKQLAAPIVLPSYIDKPAEDYQSFSMLYLTNKRENIEATTLHINGVELYSDTDVTFFNDFSEGQVFEQEFINYYLKRVTFTLRDVHIEQLKQEGFDLEKIYLTFSNGQQVPANIQHFELKEIGETVSVFDSGHGYSNSEEVRGDFSLVTQALSLNKLILPDELENMIKVKIMVLNDERSLSKVVDSVLSLPWEDVDAPLSSQLDWPLQLEKDDKVGVIIDYTEAKKNAWNIQSEITLTGMTDDGQKVKHSILLESEPSLTQKQVNELVDKEGGKY